MLLHTQESLWRVQDQTLICTVVRFTLSGRLRQINGVALSNQKILVRSCDFILCGLRLPVRGSLRAKPSVFALAPLRAFPP